MNGDICAEEVEMAGCNEKFDHCGSCEHENCECPEDRYASAEWDNGCVVAVDGWACDEIFFE
ncbi:MAG: hypothetical protein KAT00_00995 [Planctomycetes bacterium]|nr:hypothetical protein [Planctomycetota bacterium]